ncbi:unnamed protein product [Dracunculus medinensis]|uniref:Uncharacterized protein n=1 Tax=Dracunculus medinensis TaxID=318479 RepID=A0A0N4UF11_DRAME|nr:unnamed protein product [Dracunculus medinensis]
MSKLLVSVDSDSTNFFKPNISEIRLYLRLLSPSSTLLAQASAAEYFRHLSISGTLPSVSVVYPLTAYGIEDVAALQQRIIIVR